MTKLNKRDVALKGIQRKKLYHNSYFGCQVMGKSKTGIYVSAISAANKINAKQAEIDMLRLALDVSLGMHAPHMPGDSRAVPDWFVACAAVGCELDDKNGEIRKCLTLNAEVVKTLPRAPESDDRLTFSFE